MIRHDYQAKLHAHVAAIRLGETPPPLEDLQRPGLASSWRYVRGTGVALSPSLHHYTHDMLMLAVRSASLEGLVLEFGGTKQRCMEKYRVWSAEYISYRVEYRVQGFVHRIYSNLNRVYICICRHIHIHA